MDTAGRAEGVPRELPLADPVAFGSLAQMLLLGLDFQLVEQLVEALVCCLVAHHTPSTPDTDLQQHIG